MAHTRSLISLSANCKISDQRFEDDSMTFTPAPLARRHRSVSLNQLDCIEHTRMTSEDEHQSLFEPRLSSQSSTSCESCTTFNSLPDMSNLLGNTSQVISNGMTNPYADIDTDPILPLPKHGLSISNSFQCFADKIQPRRLENYMNTESLTEYLILLEELTAVSTNEMTNNELLKLLSAFCSRLRLETKLPLGEATLDMTAFERMSGEVEPLVKDIILSVIGNHFYVPHTILSKLNVDLEHGQVRRLVAALFPECPRLFEFFRFFESVKLFIAKCSMQEHIVSGDCESPFDALVLNQPPRLIDPLQTTEHPQILRMLYELCLNTLQCYNESSSDYEISYDSEHFDQMVNRSFLIFLYHSTLDSYNYQLCTQVLGPKFPVFEPDMLNHGLIYPSQLKPMSHRLVRLLYQITVTLTSIASVYQGGEQYLQSLFTFNIEPFELEKFVKQSLYMFHRDSQDLWDQLNSRNRHRDYVMPPWEQRFHDIFIEENNNIVPIFTDSATDFDMNNNSEEQLEASTSRRWSLIIPALESDSMPRARNDVVTLERQRKLLAKIEARTNNLLAPPKNCWQFRECDVCCSEKWLLIRECCRYPVCVSCLREYYTARISIGNLAIECIGDSCKELVYRDEVLARITQGVRELYVRQLLSQSSESERCKPCPRCNHLHTLTGKQEESIKTSTRRVQARCLLKLGIGNTSKASDSIAFRVKCAKCEYYWCFKCHSPWHEGLSCKDNMKGDLLFKAWVKNRGRVQNAQKCPKCKIYIQRSDGCDHMQCIRCQTDFCYRCGDKLRHIKFFGDHYSKLSIFGCKYRFKPYQPLQRKLIRGTVFGGKLVILPVLSAVGLCAGTVVLVLGIAALPLFGGIRFYRRFKHHNGHTTRTAPRDRVREVSETPLRRSEAFYMTRPEFYEPEPHNHAQLAQFRERFNNLVHDAVHDAHQLEEMDITQTMILQFLKNSNLPDYPMILPFEAASNQGKARASTSK